MDFFLNTVLPLLLLVVICSLLAFDPYDCIKKGRRPDKERSD